MDSWGEVLIVSFLRRTEIKISNSCYCKYAEYDENWDDLIPDKFAFSTVHGPIKKYYRAALPCTLLVLNIRSMIDGLFLREA